MKTIYNYVLDTLADWETGYAIAELRTQRFMVHKHDWQLRTVGPTQDPVVTMGGVTITPDVASVTINPDNAALLILPGADTWAKPEHQTIITKAKEFLAAGVPVAAICGATGALAEAGMFDTLKHTSNGLQYLQMTCPNYKGAKLYQDELAVTDQNLITAGSSAPVEFAYHIFKKLQALEPEHLEYWYGYFGKHAIDEFLKLYNALQGK